MPDDTPQTMTDVVVTNPFVNLCHMQVCARRDIPHETVEVVANRENPSGTSNGWRLVLEGGDHPPESWPARCSDDAERVHYLLVC